VHWTVVAITLPAVKIPAVGIPRGFLLNTNLLGVPITIPPTDITLWGEIPLWKETVLFDTDWIIKPIMAAINTVLPGVTQAIQDFVTKVPQAVLQGLGTVVDSIRAALLALPGTITNMIQQGIGWITGRLNQIWDSILSWWDGFKSWISQGWQDLTNRINQGWASLTQWISTAVVKPLQDLGPWISQGMQNLRSDLESRITQLSQALGENLTRFTKWIADVGYEIGDRITAGLKGLGDWILSGLKGAWDWFNTTVLGPAAKGLESAAQWVINAVKSAVETLWNAIMSIIPRRPEDSLNAALALGGVTVAALAAPQLAALAADAVHPFKTLQIRETLSDLAGALGLKNVLPFITGALVTAGFQLPFTQYINAVFRPQIPPTGQADIMYLQGHITKDQWAKIYQYHGWKDEHIEAWFKSIFIQPSDFILAKMYEIPGIPRDWILTKYRQRGYSPEDAEIMMMLGQRSAVKDEITALRSALLSAAAEGVISDRDVIAYLAELGISTEELQIISKIIDVKWRMSLTKSLMQEAIADYQAGYMSDQDLQDRLMAIGYKPEKAMSIVARQKIKREKELKRARAKTLVQAFRSQLIDEDELYAGLVEAGMIPEVARQTVAYESIKALKKSSS
jgi:hypothetical protein